MDFNIPADCWVKLKEIQKKMDKFLHLAKELKKLWTMKVILIIVGTFSTTPQKLERETEETGNKRKNPHHSTIELD